MSGTQTDRAAGAPVRGRPWTWWREASGAVADLGVLVPIAVALIVTNGLSATAVLLPAGLAYLAVALVFRLPVAVQPLKAFGAVAIAAGAGPDVIAAGALLMGAVFLLLGFTGWLDRVAAAFPRPVIRGVQLAVGLTFGRIAWDLVTSPPSGFEARLTGVPGVTLAVLLVLAILVVRRTAVLVVVAAGLAVAVLQADPDALWGPTDLVPPALGPGAFVTAAVLLVLPQLPLTFANSCLAPVDAARTYFGAAASRVTASRLAVSLGLTNLVVGAVGGMPLCHGAGGMSAHHAGGARTARAPAMIGSVLVVAALAVGAGLAAVLVAFPLPVLAALLVVAGVAHVMLLADLRGRADLLLALAVGILGVATNLAVAVVLGVLVHHLLRSRR